MSRSIEILASEKFQKDWRSVLIDKLKSIYNLSFELTIRDESYYVLSNEEKTVNIHLWLSDKERDIFPESSYLDHTKNLESIDYSVFFDKFSKIDYTIMIEEKTPRSEHTIPYMLKITKIISELSKGIILFNHEIDGYLVDYIYQSSDI